MLSISNTWQEWAAAFDSEETTKLHDQYAMRPLFRGGSTTDPQRVVVVVQAPGGAVERFMRDNADDVQRHGAILESVDVSVWSD